MEHKEQWVTEAIASQEEYLKRMRSCRGQVGAAHHFRPHGIPSAPSVVISRCVVCGVTETTADWQTLNGHSSDS